MSDRFDYNDFKTNLLALPAAFGFAFLCKLLKFPDLILWYFFSIPTHEMGHSVVAWLGSRFAIPVGAFIPMAAVTITFPGRSIFLFCLFSGLLLWWIWVSFRDGLSYPLVLSSFLLFLLVRTTWWMPDKTWQMWMGYGGVGGEFVLGTFLVISFYYRLPEWMRWDFFRFPFLIVGSYSLTSAFYLWSQIRQGTQQMPLGTFLDGRGDAGGDMDRLQQHGWKVAELVDSYYRLGVICVGVVLLHYAYFLTKKKRRSLLAETRRSPTPMADSME
ncbi:hypothetical protein K2X30_04670 [bacterium]|nr:hypothetical protein [bacterium]